MASEQTDDRGEVILYQTEDGRTALDVRLAGETVWLSLNQMAGLFGRDKSVVSRHLHNIFLSKELPRKSVVVKNATNAADGKTYQGEEQLSVPEQRKPVSATLDYVHTHEAIDTLKARLLERKEATRLFGQERIESLADILGSIEQTFDGQALYPSIEEKAAHLLYFVIKDHPFSDGNSFLFILFLRENGYLEDASGQVKINDNALVELALLIAESEPRNKELMIRLVINLVVEGVV